MMTDAAGGEYSLRRAERGLVVQHEPADGSALRQRNAAYMHHAATSGEHPRLAQLLSQPPATFRPADRYDPADRYSDVLTRILAWPCEGLRPDPPDPSTGRQGRAVPAAARMRKAS